MDINNINTIFIKYIFIALYYLNVLAKTSSILLAGEWALSLPSSFEGNLSALTVSLLTASLSYVALA